MFQVPELMRLTTFCRDPPLLTLPEQQRPSSPRSLRLNGMTLFLLLLSIPYRAFAGVGENVGHLEAHADFEFRLKLSLRLGSDSVSRGRK